MKTGVKTTAPMYGVAAAGKNHHIRVGDIVPADGAMTIMDIDGTVVTGINKNFNCVIWKKSMSEACSFSAVVGRPEEHQHGRNCNLCYLVIPDTTVTACYGI
jgi:hypothetical protein